jgi:hypothetical protein
MQQQKKNIFDNFSSLPFFALSHAASYAVGAVKMFSTFLRHPFFSCVFVFHDRRPKTGEKKELLKGREEKKKFLKLVLLFSCRTFFRMCKKKKNS